MEHTMRHMIVGAGEVGKSLHKVLSAAYEDVGIRDVEKPQDIEPAKFLHICFPHGPGEEGAAAFHRAVVGYQEEYGPDVTVIHSSVPVGTSDQLGAVHSPIHGRHPNLEGGIRTFVKYVGGADRAQVLAVAMELFGAGVPVKAVKNAATSELSKLACTRSLGLSAVEMHEIHAECEFHGADFNEVYGWRRHYNAGYQALGMQQFTRPVLDYTPGPIGGHCVVPNCRFAPDRPLEKLILERNAEYAK